jgi:hypothetical protein
LEAVPSYQLSPCPQLESQQQDLCSLFAIDNLATQACAPAREFAAIVAQALLRHRTNSFAYWNSRIFVNFLLSFFVF